MTPAPQSPLGALYSSTAQQPLANGNDEQVVSATTADTSAPEGAGASFGQSMAEASSPVNAKPVDAKPVGEKFSVEESLNEAAQGVVPLPSIPQGLAQQPITLLAGASSLGLDLPGTTPLSGPGGAFGLKLPGAFTQGVDTLSDEPLNIDGESTVTLTPDFGLDFEQTQGIQAPVSGLAPAAEVVTNVNNSLTRVPEQNAGVDDQALNPVVVTLVLQDDGLKKGNRKAEALAPEPEQLDVTQATTIARPVLPSSTAAGTNQGDVVQDGVSGTSAVPVLLPPLPRGDRDRANTAPSTVVTVGSELVAPVPPGGQAATGAVSVQFNAGVSNRTSTDVVSFKEVVTPLELDLELSLKPERAAPALKVEGGVNNTSLQSFSGIGGRVSVPVDVQFGKGQWGSVIAERTAGLVMQNIHSAQMQLDPPELGPLTVKIQVQNEQASVSFVATNAAVKDALDQTLPRLKELLNEQGLELADASVSDQSQQHQGRQDEKGSTGMPGAKNLAQTEPAMTPAGQVTLASGIDYFV